jgi:hypothetical protein
VNNKVDSELQELDEKLTKKIKDIESLLEKHARPAAGLLAASQVDPWAEARQDRPSGSRTRSASTPATVHDDGYDPCKVW